MDDCVAGGDPQKGRNGTEIGLDFNWKTFVIIIRAARKRESGHFVQFD